MEVCLIYKVIRRLIAVVYVASFSSCLFGETVTLGDPTKFQAYGNYGYSAELDYTRTYLGDPSIRIGIVNGSGPSWAGLTYISALPIQNVKYYQYDELGSATPFYNYLYLGSTTFAWQDSGLSGRILSFGGENYSSLYRSVGWHKIEATIDSFDGSSGNHYINYKIDDVAVARIQISNPILNLAFDISSAGGGSFSYNIAMVTLSTIPEPFALSLLAVGFSGLAMMRRRRS